MREELPRLVPPAKRHFAHAEDGRRVFDRDDVGSLAGAILRRGKPCTALNTIRQARRLGPMDKRGLSERDICTKYITPAIVRSGWDVQVQVRENVHYDGWMTRGLAQRGDVLFTTEAPLGNVAQLLSDERVALAQRIITTRPTEVASPAFLKTVLMSPVLQTVIRRHATGTMAMGIKSAKLKLVPFPVPSLDEQYRIVERVEQLMKVCDDLEASLRQAEDRASKLVEAAVQELVA